ncbi:MAG: hypothetical protein LUH15_00585 [Tannerellaceae bacterium]|nr:hypothetical protein [Tannerellaceae bacterium]
MAFLFFISFIILLRIGELAVARRNEKWLLQQGAVEYGQRHYPFIVGLHVLFILSLILEYWVRGDGSYSRVLLVLFFVLLACKVWVISTLGKFWNTKIYRVRNFPLVRRGPYKYIKHPNYLIVIAEIAIIPLIFHLYYTAVIFTVLNGIMLAIRIREENKVLTATF